MPRPPSRPTDPQPFCLSHNCLRASSVGNQSGILEPSPDTLAERLGGHLRTHRPIVAGVVIVLVGSIPISPQGAGVMEYFAILLTQKQGATVSQAFALTMSIRMVQILWNLTGGIFVFRGGYHAPTEEEQNALGEDEAATAKAA